MAVVEQAGFSRNRLLSRLAPEDFTLLEPDLRRVSLSFKEVLEEPGRPIEFVFFPEPSVCSVVATNAGGERLEVGIFGPEGMSGTALVVGADRPSLTTFVQVPGFAVRLPAAALREALETSLRLRLHLLRFVYAFAIQISHTALANGRYPLGKRLARWLLMCHDRVDGDSVALTHDILALMLGVRRAGVTTALNLLQRSEIIQPNRARIDILDRNELLEAAGSSYGTPEAEYDRVMRL